MLRTTNLSSGSTLTETAEERERRRVREREEREARLVYRALFRSKRTFEHKKQRLSREFAVLEEERRQAEEQVILSHVQFPKLFN